MCLLAPLSWTSGWKETWARRFQRESRGITRCASHGLTLAAFCMKTGNMFGLDSVTFGWLFRGTWIATPCLSWTRSHFVHTYSASSLIFSFTYYNLYPSYPPQEITSIYSVKSTPFSNEVPPQNYASVFNKPLLKTWWFSQSFVNITKSILFCPMFGEKQDVKAISVETFGVSNINWFRDRLPDNMSYCHKTTAPLWGAPRCGAPEFRRVKYTAGNAFGM